MLIGYDDETLGPDGPSKVILSIPTSLFSIVLIRTIVINSGPKMLITSVTGL